MEQVWLRSQLRERERGNTNHQQKINEGGMMASSQRTSQWLFKAKLNDNNPKLYKSLELLAGLQIIRILNWT